MSIAKTKREKKRQLGQFLTPPHIARQLVRNLHFEPGDRVLEPSMGDGSFIIPIIEKFLELYDGAISERLDRILANNVFGVEIDENLYDNCLSAIKQRWGYLPQQHNFLNQDFFRCHFLDRERQSFRPIPFSYIIGNPPFGGTLDPAIQDDLDKEFGFRQGEKIKKETYSFFIVKSLDLLSTNGKLLFICSDTFMTIKTMRGLRRLLMGQGQVEINDLNYFSDETKHPMVVLRFTKNGYANSITLNGKGLDRSKIDLAENFSWRITDDLAKYFEGPLIGQYMIATSGMTVGKNEYFVREIVAGKIKEPYSFEFYNEPITLADEIARARLGKLSPRKMEEIRRLEATGGARRNVRVIERDEPLEITIPHPDYCYFNKGIGEIVYAPPTHVIYWKDEGDAVLTFKKNGNWYLHGVGGQRFFKREGITWQLISQNLSIRYLPAGYILDSGAPCAFLRPGVAHDELYFILGWALTHQCNFLLKEVINHTKNIQGKDFERLPYPFWVSADLKSEIIRCVKKMIEGAMNGRNFTRHSPEIRSLDETFEYNQGPFQQPANRKPVQVALPLFH